MQFINFLVLLCFFSGYAEAKFHITRDELNLSTLSESHYFWWFQWSTNDGSPEFCTNGGIKKKRCDEYYKNGFPIGDGIICKATITRSISNQTLNNKTVGVNKIEDAIITCNVNGLSVRLDSIFCGESLVPIRPHEDKSDSDSLTFEKNGKRLGRFFVKCREKSKND